jgi:hypothetical protein
MYWWCSSIYLCSPHPHFVPIRHSLLHTLVLCFAGSNLPLCSLLDCQATQARLATSKLPQPLVNLVGVAATPAILCQCSSVCTTLKETWILVLAVLGHLAHACLHHTMLFKILSNRAQCSTTRYVLIQTRYILVLTRYFHVHTGMYWLHTRLGHIAQGICIPCTYMYRLCMHQYTLFILGGERFHVSSHTLTITLHTGTYPWSQNHTDAVCTDTNQVHTSVIWVCTRSYSLQLFHQTAT